MRNSHARARYLSLEGSNSCGFPQGLAADVDVSYIDNTQGGQGTEGASAMEFIRSMQPRDWLIAIVAFVGGAFIF